MTLIVCSACEQPMTQTGQCTNPECPSKKKMIRLNIGCGTKPFKGWTNTDIDPEIHIKGYSNEMSSSCTFNYKDDTVDEIYASHLLDHLSRKNELDNTLHEWYRVLKPGGILRVAVSDFEAVSKLYRDGMDLESLWGHIVGGHKSEYDKHGCIFDFNVLRRYLETHGFVDVKRYDWREFLPIGFQDNSCAAIPKYDLNGYPTSLNVVCLKGFISSP
jgi:predicted SAM-dependent methyltransferase